LFVALAHYLLYPPAKSIITGKLDEQGLREYFLTLFPLPLLARPWSIRSLPFLLAFLPYIFSLPSVPQPDDTSFMVLHFALGLQILFLHFPHPPSPVFLLPFQLSLPLSTLLTHSMSRMFFPVVIFFLPVTFLAAVLLSASVAETTLGFLSMIPSDPSPMQSRVVFLLLFAVVILLLLLSLIVGAAKYPFILMAEDKMLLPLGQNWDRYSRRVGLDARKTFVAALVRYSQPYYFPPPLNVVQLVFIRLPWRVLLILGKKGPFPHLEVVERILWRASVGPIVWLMSGVWLWKAE